MIILVDTNILLRWAHFQSVVRPLAIAAHRALRDRGDSLVISPQNLVEFWSVATRPVKANGLEFTTDRADRVARRLERFFPLVPDVPAIHDEWRRLVVAWGAKGRQVHDARLVAVMRTHGISHLLTFNTADFARYPGITVIHPRDVAAPP